MTAVTVNEIEQVLVCMHVAFRPSRGDELDWPEETFLKRLWTMGDLSDEHVWAWEQVLADYDTICGTGFGGASPVRYLMNNSFGPHREPPIMVALARKDGARHRLNTIGDKLTREETAILLDLLLDFRDRLDGRFVAWIGWPLSRLRNQDHLRGLAIGKLTSLLNRLALCYGRDDR
jgi:hypothetical protein